MAQDEQVWGADHEKDERIAIKAIEKATVSRKRLVLTDRKSVDVADTAPAEIAGRCMMDRMGLAPIAVGRQGEDADQTSQHVIGPTGSEKRSVPTVMLDDEQPDQKPCHRQGKQ